MYAIFDVLSEMGGLSGLFVPFVKILLELLQTQNLYLVSLMKHMRPVLRKKIQTRNSALE